MNEVEEPRQGFVKLIRSDVRAKARWVYGSVTTKNVLKTLVTDGTAAMILYRLMQAAAGSRLVPLAMLFNKLNTVFGGCIIGRRARFGPGFVLVHSHGVVINSSVTGGRNITIEHQVTIGAEKGESPRLGNDIFVGCGARIIGGVTVGDRALIGANAVVLNDVGSGTTVGGVPARVVGNSE